MIKWMIICILFMLLLILFVIGWMRDDNNLF